MPYFIFTKDSDNIEGSIYRIVENEYDLNNSNILQSAYKIIETSQLNFEAVKYGQKSIVKYSQNIIIYNNDNTSFLNKTLLQIYIDWYKKYIKEFTDENKNSINFNKWNNYYNQLNNLNLDNIEFPLNKSLEYYFNELGQISLHPLQLS